MEKSFKLNSSESEIIPKISVIMPAYNAQDFISDAIESILKQTCQDFEFIILNDGSIDKTSDIIKSFSDPRIIFLDNKKHAGLVSVLNQGLDIARGKYIARMDSDDISLAQRLEKQLDFMEKNPDIGVLGTWADIFGDFNCKCTHPINITEIELINGCQIVHPSVFIRKSILDEYNLRYNPDFEACEDFELWSRMIQVTHMYNLPEVLLKYYRHKKSVCSTRKRLQKKNTKRIQNIIIKRIKKRDF